MSENGTNRAGQAEFASLPRWRRPRRLRRQLAFALVTTAVLAVVIFGALNFVAARDLLVTGTEDQLAAVGATRAGSIAAGAQRLTSEISVAASDVSLAETLETFAEEFVALGEESLTPEQLAELEDFYQDRVIGPLQDVGLGPVSVRDLLPASEAGRWLQYHYTVRPAGEPPPVDPGDGSGYSELNAEVTDVVRRFSDNRGGGDVLLIDDAGTIVYSLEKRNDVGTNLVTGPYADGALAQVVAALPRARIGSTLLTSYGVSSTGRPALYAVSPLSNGVTVVGGLAVEIPVGALTYVTSAGDDWEGIGLDEGDSYVVGLDGLLQSEPRAWIEDPELYLERLRSGDDTQQAAADLIGITGSPVGVQTIDTAPVRSGIDGENFRGASTDYTGRRTFAASQSFDVSGQSWVVVTEVPRSVVMAPLLDYLIQIVIVLSVVLPIVAGLGWWLSRVLTRPIRPTVEAAESIVAGERNPDVDTARGDEFGDLARRLTVMASALEAHEAELAEEYERTRQLLLAVLPPALVDDDGNIVGSGAEITPATVVAVIVAPSQEKEDPELVGHALPRAAEVAEQVAQENGLQRVRVSADRYLFLARGGPDDVGAVSALTFADELRGRLERDGGDVELDLHVGLSSGPVATGVLSTGALTFGAWGDPVRRALALAALSSQDRVLIDASTAHGCDETWRLERAHDVVDLDDEPMDLYTRPPVADAASYSADTS